MSSYLTSDTLIASVERKAHVPGSQVTFEPEDYLAFANEEIKIGLLPSIMQFHEEFFVVSTEVALVNDQAAYDIPDRAVGAKVRSLFVRDNNGIIREMARIPEEDESYWQNTSVANAPHSFYLQNNSIVIVPTPKAPIGKLVIRYFQRPNELVTSDRVATIKTIDTGTNTVTVDAVPSVFSYNTKLDLLETKGTHRCRATDLTASNINSSTNSISFSSLPSSLVVGDIIALAGECYIPQMPDELHSVLAQRVACRCLEAIGDTVGLQAANQKLAEMEQKTGVLIDNRTEGNPVKVNNLRGPLRQSKIRRRRNLW
jgi:hypothetical protein